MPAIVRKLNKKYEDDYHCVHQTHPK